MGHRNGIAQVSAEAGFETIAQEINSEYLSKGLKSIDDSLNRGVSKGKYDKAYKDAVTTRMKGITDVGELTTAILSSRLFPKILS